jgi:hypothetical protein
VGPCTVDVDVLRTGRRTATASARVSSQGADVLAMLGTFGEQSRGGESVIDGVPPELPPIEQCVRSTPPVESGFGEPVNALVRPGDEGFHVGRPSGRAETAGWFEFTDGRTADEIGLLLVADAFAPVVLHPPEFPVSWAPTLD